MKYVASADFLMNKVTHYTREEIDASPMSQAANEGKLRVQNHTFITPDGEVFPFRSPVKSYNTTGIIMELDRLPTGFEEHFTPYHYDTPPTRCLCGQVPCPICKGKLP